MLDFLVYALLFLFLVWLLTRVFLRAPDHSAYDEPTHPTVDGRSGAGPEKAELLRRLDTLAEDLKDVPRNEFNVTIRRLMDEGMLGAPVAPDTLGVTVSAVNADGVPAEWVLAPGADPDRRLLYLHGGGFYAGSPMSARMITAALSKSAGVAVLAVDYRLMPENRRADSITDCRAAYAWMVGNGPSGAGPASAVFAGGDSAGGNLALMLSAWARDDGPRALDAVVAFAPSTDSTLEGGSFRRNIPTDPLLGPAMGPFARLPVTIKVLIAFIAGRVNPRKPDVSPLFGNLDGLPPTLVQVAQDEMLFDDACRYVNKAASQGSPAELEVWPGMVHVFQMFGHIVPEANEALERAGRFLAAHPGS